MGKLTRLRAAMTLGSLFDPVNAIRSDSCEAMISTWCTDAGSESTRAYVRW